MKTGRGDNTIGVVETTAANQENFMVDQAKRNTLKNVAGIGVGAVALATSTNALSKVNNIQANALASSSAGAAVDLADIQLTTRLSAQTNELEVVLTNVGSVPANITDMTPAEINTARGRFDFDAMFTNGNVKLAMGESVSVPMQHHTVVLDGSSVGNRSASLTKALQQNVSIVTDGDALAAVSFVNGTAQA